VDVALIGIAVADIVVGVCALVWGVVTEFQQSHEYCTVYRAPEKQAFLSPILSRHAVGVVAGLRW
jgi:hypothetical protein